MTTDVDIRSTVAGVLRIPTDQVTDAVPLRELVRDSFVLVELVVELQDAFGVQFFQDDLLDVATVGDLARLVTTRT